MKANINKATKAMYSLRRTFKLTKTTPSYMVYGEIGKHPIIVDINMWMISSSKVLTEGRGNKYSEILFKIIKNDTINANTFK